MRVWAFLSLVLLGVAVFLFAGGFEHPPVASVQRGFRGTGMAEVENPRLLAAKFADNQVPEAQPPAEPGGPAATEVYQNVQVLNDLSAEQFNRTMAAITEWVAPEEQGCTYCHNPENMADESLYTYKVARRMLQMTRHLNADWQSHVGNSAQGGAGVTCYTCHRGQPVPANIWFNDPGRKHTAGLAGSPAGQNGPGPEVGLASLPSDPFSPYLNQAPAEVRVTSSTALPEGNRSSIKQTEWTYGLMMHFAGSLGVNCTYCHNSRQFASWDESTPARTSAWYGLRMVRDLNTAYLDPLGPTYPPHRLGTLGDAPKVNCATCHQGAYKPLYGAPVIKDYPELAGPGQTPAPTAPASNASSSTGGGALAIVKPLAAAAP
jgi:photosynthetic reaction center cytochrome c subunit